MNIDELKQIQAEHGLQDTHLVWIGRERFTLAHTDFERAASADPIYLTRCEYHEWLRSRSKYPAEPGYVYKMTCHVPDAYSEAWGQQRFEFERLEVDQ